MTPRPSMAGCGRGGGGVGAGEIVASPFGAVRSERVVLPPGSSGPRPASGVGLRVWVWLPPQYDQAGYARTAFPALRPDG
ncbi:MAG TPA: hypothetical protein VI248_10595 [Kineosporiaceae bacterium]